MSEIPNLLRQIRLEKNITLAELSTAIDTWPKTISEWETSKVSPMLNSLERWVNALGYELDLHLKEPANVQ